MDIFVYNTDFELVGIVDNYESFIWTDRYNDTGDFEIYAPVESGLMDWIKIGYYLSILSSEKTMIVETFKVSTDNESGNHLSITGRSLESLLDRRIIWGAITYSGSLQDAIYSMVNAAFVNPSNSSRKIPNFILADKSTSTAITSLTIESAEYKGVNILDTIKSLCETENLGFKVVLNQNNQFVFSLFKGVDRSYEQDTNAYVVFSEEFDNLYSSDYEESLETYKNVCLVCGGSGDSEFYASYGTSTGLDRRETYTSASECVSTAGASQAGKEYLNDYKQTKKLEGDADTDNMFKLNKDFFLGDLIEIMNEYGVKSRAIVTEVIVSISDSEFKTYPTFELDKNEQATNS